MDDNQNWFLIFKHEHKKGLCDYLNTYFGEIWYDVQRNMGAVPKTCPLSAVRVYTYFLCSKYNCCQIVVVPFRVSVLLELLMQHFVLGNLSDTRLSTKL